MTDQKKIRIGDRVRMTATHTGTITEVDEDGGFSLSDERYGKAYGGRLGPHLQVEVLPPLPEHWPPKPGELWIADGWLWAVRQDGRATCLNSNRDLGTWASFSAPEQLAGDTRRVWAPTPEDGVR